MKTSTFSTPDSPDPSEEDIIERLLKNPPDPIKALETQYEIALARLLERRLDPADERSQRLARRITRHFVFNYYFGFVLFKFSPSYRDKSASTARQRAIEEALQKLARFEPARQLMAEYFTAALQQRLHRMLREFLNAHRATLHPRRAASRTAARMILADDWEKLGRYAQTFYQGLPFGLSGFHLLFKSSGIVQPQEFEVLLEYAHRLARERDWQDITDVVSTLSAASLSPEQKDTLLNFVRSLLDVERYAYTEEQDPKDRIEGMGLSPTLTGVFKTADRVVERQAHERMETRDGVRSFREQYDLDRRREETAKMLGILAGQEPGALVALQASDLVDMAFGDLLPVALKHLQVMETLARHLGEDSRGRLSDDHFKTLRESGQLLDKEPTESLLNIIGEQSDSCPWAAQILQNIPGLTEEADRRISTIVQREQNPAVLRALIQMYHGLQERRGRTPRELEGALFARLMTLLFDPEFRLQPEWVSILGAAGGSLLQEVLESINDILSEGSSSPLGARGLEILQAVASWAEQMPRPDAVVLAACWLVDPTASMEDSSAPVERVQQAISLLRRPTDHLTQQTAAYILLLTLAQRPAARKVIAQAARTLRYPELALPLLEILLDVTTTGDRYSQDHKLFAEALKSVAALKPLTPEAISLLQTGFMASRSWDSPLHSEITPAFVYDEILPLLVHEVSPEAVPALIEIVWRNYCDTCSQAHSVAAFEQPSLRLSINGKIHRYLHTSNDGGYDADGLVLLCALQSLTNVTDLSLSQQRVIWRLYRTSWRALTKGLSLLILGRQRPLREDTIRALVHILRKNPMAAVVKMTAPYLFRSLLFRLFRRRSPPDDADVNYMLLCQGIAVNAVSALLRQHRDNVLVQKYQRDMESGLLSVVSLFRHGMEPHLTEYTSLGTSASGTTGMAQMMGATPEEAIQGMGRPSWIAQPADLAYQALQELIAGGALPSLQGEGRWISD